MQQGGVSILIEALALKTSKLKREKKPRSTSLQQQQHHQPCP